MKTVQTTTEAFELQQQAVGSGNWGTQMTYDGELAQHRATERLDYQTETYPNSKFRIVRVTVVRTVTKDESLSITREVLQ